VPAEGLQGPASTSGHGLSHRIPAGVSAEVASFSSPSPSEQDGGGGRAGWKILEYHAPGSLVRFDARRAD
jgi:hypothetical protein